MIKNNFFVGGDIVAHVVDVDFVDRHCVFLGLGYDGLAMVQEISSGDVYGIPVEDLRFIGRD